MKKPHLTANFIVLIVVLGSLALSACSTVASAQQVSGLEAQVHTAVAATLVQQVVAATVAAAQPVAMAEEPAEQQAQATQAPTPTATPAPTEPPPPTATPTEAAPASGPTIIADQNTNCRAGPSTGYKVVAYFMEGDESTVEGRDSTKDWWYIVSPEAGEENCWVWDGSTTVVGDTSTLPVVAAPAAPTYKYGAWYDDCYDYKGYGCVYYPNDTCQKMIYWHGYLVCVQYKPVCTADSWWTCNPYGYCTCKPTYNDPWEKPNCPPVTSVNYKKYCTNYPQCCSE
jgi:hypothetical protein